MRLTLAPAVMAMAVIVVASNILVQFQLGNWLTWGALTYPFAFLVTDITNRIHGRRAAQRVVVVGFVTGLFCSLIAAGAGTTTIRIATASAAAFFLGQMLDVILFDRMRYRPDWWKAPLISSVMGSVLDTIIFFTIAFAAFLPHDANTGWSNEIVPLLGQGPELPLWMSLGIADWGVKMGLALLTLVPFRILVRKILSTPA
ncbi:MAG: hypothetical protein DI498_01005 [Paracoccus denitrificans]|nr:MAG: hypothetical protein DI498_01005 [Paracoccus denitrificans]PZO86336.1 MAG: hypothetical protein DI633_01005 [Paracoccus denitrificans]